ncbi:MAG: transporter [Legionellales bacterium]|nr:transporter [Legionellales bacterium]
MIKWLNKIPLTLIFIPVLWNHALADTVSDPCSGSGGLLSLVDRPTAADNACPVPYDQAILEMGYQHQELYPTGNQNNYPQPEVRFGLPYSTEFVFLPPNFIAPSVSPAGFGASTIGLKHELGYTENWLGSIESLVTLPTGSDANGSDGTGIAVNGIINYTFNSHFTLSGMFGVTSETVSESSGGDRFSSFNPDLVLTWTLGDTSTFQVFAEVYGQTHTGPDQGSGFNADGGVAYLVFKMLSVDVEYGHRLSGLLGGFDHYVGTGLALYFV